MLHTAVSQIREGHALSETAAFDLFTHILSGTVSEAALAEFLTALAHKGPHIDELVGAARALRTQARAFPLTSAQSTLPILDTCGTGGAAKLFNVSTISAFVVAAAAQGRIIVAKHGNRSRTGRGSSELLEALGINLALSNHAQATCVQELGLCFLHAPDRHPGMKHVSAVRKALPFPTIFNLLGPLVNPAGATHQLVGVPNLQAAQLISQSLHRLGCTRVLVTTSSDGLDELTTTSLNHAIEVRPPALPMPLTIDTQALDLPQRTIPDLQVASLEDAARVAREILSGQDLHSPRAEMVALNAGASLWLCGLSPTLADGRKLATVTLASPDPHRVLNRYVELSHT